MSITLLGDYVNPPKICPQDAKSRPPIYPLFTGCGNYCIPQKIVKAVSQCCGQEKDVKKTRELNYRIYITPYILYI